MPHEYLSFSTAKYFNGKVVGTSTSPGSSNYGNALSVKSVTIVDIPAEYEGEPVVELGYFSFATTQITSIFIPKTIRLIGNAAFFPSPQLKVVRFDKGSLLEKIDYNAFSGCTSLEKIDLPPNLKTITENSASYPTFKNAPLTCVSYLGMNELNTNYIFSNSPKIHVLSNYTYSQIGKKAVTKDGLSCGVSNERFNKAKSTSNDCTCAFRYRIPRIIHFKM